MGTKAADLADVRECNENGAPCLLRCEGICVYGGMLICQFVDVFISYFVNIFIWKYCDMLTR